LLTSTSEVRSIKFASDCATKVPCQSKQTLVGDSKCLTTISNKSAQH